MDYIWQILCFNNIDAITGKSGIMEGRNQYG